MNVGPIPTGLFVLHRCDNPPCVRPDHLFLGTQADNNADMYAKGRGVVGERVALAKLTAADVRAIRVAVGTNKEVGRAFGVDAAEVSRIKAGKAWRSVA